MYFPDPTTGAPLEGEELVQAKFNHMNNLMVNYLKARQALTQAFYYKGQLIFEPNATDKTKLQTMVIDDLAAQITAFMAELLTTDNNPV